MQAKKKKVIIITALLIILIPTVLFLAKRVGKESISVSTDSSQAIDELASSISYSNGKISFTIPVGNETWNILISGRIEVDGIGGMSVHYLEDESGNNSWEAGKTYSFDISDGTYTELNMDVQSGGRESSINIMQFLP